MDLSTKYYKVESIDGDYAHLKDAVSILKKIDDIAIIKLSSKDVVRHKLVQAIINAYERAEEQRSK